MNVKNRNFTLFHEIIKYQHCWSSLSLGGWTLLVIPFPECGEGGWVGGLERMHANSDLDMMN